MRPAIRRLLRSLPFAVLACAAMAVVAVVPARAASLRVVASDPRGVTLQLAVGAWSLSAPNAAGRAQVQAEPGARTLGEPGRALLPAWSALVALPPDARPSVRVLAGSATESRDGVRLAVAGKPSFAPDGAGGWEPTREDVTPLADGLWPTDVVRMGTPSAFRGRHLLGVEVRPFRYDESAGRLELTPTLTVRIDFNRPTGAAALPAIASAPDAHFDDVLRGTVLNWDQGASWRVAPGGATGAGSLFARPTRPAGAASFNEGQPEVRVKIDTTGIYSLPFEQLAAHGYPAGVPVAQVSVHRHEFLEGANPPYATIDLPIEVDDDNANGVFDAGDRIWVYVRQWNERSGAGRMQRFWGDAEVIYATVAPAGGLRVGTRSGWRGAAGVTPLASYPFLAHWERDWVNMMPNVSIPSDTTIDLYHWTDLTFYYDRPDSITFTVNDIDTTQAAKFMVNWVGRKPNLHYVGAAVKTGAGVQTTIVDSLGWYGMYPAADSSTTHGSALGEGVNRFLDWGKRDPSAPNATTNGFANAGLDWFETTYWRRFNAVHDVLAFNSAGATGLFQVHLAGFRADSIRIWDVTDPEHPVRLLVDASHYTSGALAAVDVQDSVIAGQRRSYVAAVVQDPLSTTYGPHVPPDGNFGTVTRRNLYANTAGDYLLVAPEAFLPAVQPLVTLRAQQGLRVIVAPAEAVYDEFNGGRHSADALRRFAKYAYAHWSARFMLLVGDGSLDPANRAGQSGVDYIPVNPVPGPVSVPDGYEITASDNLYGCLTGNCDPIFGLGDVVPELMIGRLPVNSVADVQNVVAKLVNYENLSGDTSWRRHVVLLADDDFSGETTFGGGSTGANTYCEKSNELFFAGLSNTCARVMLEQGGLTQMNPEKFYLKAYLGNTQPTYVDPNYGICRTDRTAARTYTHNAITPQLFSHVNAGTLWLNFQGHANEYVLTHEDLYINSGDFVGSDDKWDFTNTDQPVLWTAFSCHSNMFARGNAGPQTTFGGCLGEDMVTLPQRGAIAAWASDCYEIVPRDTLNHLNVELARSLFADPPHDSQLSDHGARLVLGEVIQQTFQRFVPAVASYSLERGVAVTYTLLGDPATRMSIGRPQTVVNANDTLAVDGQPVRLHSPGDTLAVVASLVSTARLDSVQFFINIGAGDVRIPIGAYHPGGSTDSAYVSPAFPDTVGGGLYGGRKFRLTYRTTLLPQTYDYRIHTVDRDGLATDFTLLFQLDATVRVDGVAIHDGDDVSPTANLSVLLQSPVPINPATDLEMLVNSDHPQIVAVPAPGDVSGREWILTWPHAALGKDDYTIKLTLRGGTPLLRHFKVSTAVGDLRLAGLFAFPNPFDNDGTNFQFTLLGSDPADVRISVFTISGRKLWSNDYRGLSPGWHQVHWDGNDAEGSAIANGVYFYRLSAATASGRRVDQLGRLIKLRKPRHVDIATTP